MRSISYKLNSYNKSPVQDQSGVTPIRMMSYKLYDINYITSCDIFLPQHFYSYHLKYILDWMY